MNRLLSEPHTRTAPGLGGSCRTRLASVNRGVGLIELMVVIAIMGVTAAFAAPSFQSLTENSQIRTTSESVRDAIMLGRTEAIRRGSAVTLVGTGNPRWSNGWALHDATGALIREGQFATGLRVTLVNGPADDRVVFRPNGTVNNTPANEMYVWVQGRAGSSAIARAIRLNRGVSLCRQGDNNCPI